MQRKTSIMAAVPNSRDLPAPSARQPLALRALAGSAFVLLAVAVCVRPLFREHSAVAVPEILAPPPVWWESNPTVMHLSHLLAAAGLAMGALWIVLGRRRWHFSGLEIGAGVLLTSVLLALPQASDKRQAINGAIGVILPILLASLLHQILVGRRLWQRALLACLMAIVVASAAKGTAQHFWEADQALRDYQQEKAALWAQMGRNADDPQAQIYEDRIKARQPSGYFFHPNVMASLLLLGLAGTAAVLAGTVIAATRRGPERQSPPKPTPPASPGRRLVPAILAAALLIALAGWLVFVISWIGSAGAIVGISTVAATAAGAWLLRRRPRALALSLAGGLALLQGTLIVLALQAPSLYHSLETRGGKVKSMAVRLNYWEGAIRIFAQHPLAGVGPTQFGKYYTAFKPPYASEDPSHPHDWLLAQAAECGLVGVLGLLIALVLPGWRILRSLGQPADDTDDPRSAALLPAALVVLGCWLLVGLGTWDTSLTGVAAASLAAVPLVCLSGRSARIGQAILLAGLVGFLVHAMVEMTAGVPGATWLFWATLALAMTWAGATLPAALQPAAPRLLRPALLLPIVAAVAVVALTIHPLASTRLIDQAQQAVRAGRPDQAVLLLRQAAATDPLDSTPLKAAALLRQKMGRQNPPQALTYQREAAAMFRVASQRDSVGYMVWRNLALAEMYVAAQTDDFAAVRQAVADLQKALTLYPNWPVGWLELATMAGAQSATQPDNPALLRIALDALDRAQSLDDLWPADDARKFKPRERTQIEQMRRQFSERLHPATPRTPQ